MSAPVGALKQIFVGQEATRGTAAASFELLTALSESWGRTKTPQQPAWNDGNVGEHAPYNTVWNVSGNLQCEMVYDKLQGTTPVGAEMLIAMFCGSGQRLNSYNVYGPLADRSNLTTLTPFMTCSADKGPSVCQTRGIGVSSLSISGSANAGGLTIEASGIGHSQDEDTFAAYGQVTDRPKMTHVRFQDMVCRISDFDTGRSNSYITEHGTNKLGATHVLDISNFSVRLDNGLIGDYGAGANVLEPLVASKFGGTITLQIPRASASQFGSAHDSSDPDWFKTMRDNNTPMALEFEFSDPGSSDQFYMGFPTVYVSDVQGPNVQGDGIMGISVTLMICHNIYPHLDQVGGADAQSPPAWYDAAHHGLQISGLFTDSAVNLNGVPTAGATTITTGAGATAAFNVGDMIRTDGTGIEEVMIVTGIPSDTSLTVIRGAKGSVGRSDHDTSANIYINTTPAIIAPGDNTGGLGMVDGPFVISCKNSRTACITFS